MTHDFKSRAVESLLEGATIHKRWTDDYRTPENQGFFDEAFACIARLIDAPARSLSWMPAVGAALIPYVWQPGASWFMRLTFQNPS